MGEREKRRDRTKIRKMVEERRKTAEKVMFVHYRSNILV